MGMLLVRGFLPLDDENNIVAGRGPAINAPVGNLGPELASHTAKNLR
jgi:hypothetical protein